MTLVHVTLPNDLLSDPVSLRDRADQIVKMTHMTGVNDKRLSRYAILSGLVQESRIPELRSLPDVVVEIDEVRKPAS